MQSTLLLHLVLTISSASAALLGKPTIARRNVLYVAAAPILTFAPATIIAAPEAPDLQRTLKNFELVPDPGRPHAHYLENAGNLADNLVLFADGGMERSVGEALDAEITAFAAMYAPRPGALVDAGPTPGLSELKTAYDALAYHFARYSGRDAAEPLPDALASTVRRNAIAAQKRIRKTQAAQEAAKGAWPTCRGIPLGARDTQCSTEEL